MSTLSSFNRLGNLIMLGPKGEIGRVNNQKAFQFDVDLTRRFASYTPTYLKQYMNNPDDRVFRIGLIFQSRREHPWGSETMLFGNAIVHTLYPVSGSNRRELTAFQRKKRENSVHYGLELLLEYELKDSPGVPIFLPVLFDCGTTLEHYEKWLGEPLAGEDPATPVIEVLNFIGHAASSRSSLEPFIPMKEQLHAATIRKDGRKSIEAKIMEQMRSTTTTTTVEPPLPPSKVASWATPLPAAPTAPSSGAPIPLHGEPNSAQWYHPSMHETICEKLQKYLMWPRQYAHIDDVRHFQRFRDFSPEQQQSIAALCPIYEVSANTVLLEQGTTDQWNLYVLQGDVQLVAADGEKKIINGGTDNARNALATLKPRKFTVTTLTMTHFLLIHELMVAEIQRQQGSGLKLI